MHLGFRRQRPQRQRRSHVTALQRLLLQNLQSRNHGIALPIALVAALALIITLAALSSRTTSGLFSSVFQGVNREARDVAEAAINDFAATLNREENRGLWVAGNDQKGSWGPNAELRNPCTQWTPVDAANPAGAYQQTLSAPALTTADNFAESSSAWRQLVGGDSTQQYRVEDITYRYEDRTGDPASRRNFNFATDNVNIPGITVRNSALQGGTRTLARVTIQGKVTRNGQESYARVTREFEVVPKCCKRSFGKNTFGGLGGIDAGSTDTWGADEGECPVYKDDGIGRGLIGSLDGGEPDGSGNTLDIRDENNELVTQALCWAGNKSGEPSDLGGNPNQDCVNNRQSLGAANKNKPGLSFVPLVFSLQLPNPFFNLPPGTENAGYVSSLGGTLNFSTYGNVWFSGGQWTMQKWESAQLMCWPSSPSCNQTSDPPIFYYQSNPLSSTDQPWGRNNFNFIGSPPCVGAACLSPLSTSGNPDLNSDYVLDLDDDAKIYLEVVSPANSTAMPAVKYRSDGTTSPMNNCTVSRAPDDPYYVVDCFFRSIDLGNDELLIDTTYAMFNFHFDPGYTGQYLIGNTNGGATGNQQLKRVHCAWNPTTAAAARGCTTVLNWADYQLKCDSVAGSDPRCQSLGIKDPGFDRSQLLNFYSLGSGIFTVKGTSSAVGVNIYAPYSDVALVGGGSADPNIMGRVWADDITLIGNVKVRLPRSMPAFCGSLSCPPPGRVPLFDLVGRSYSHASGFGFSNP